jgi:YgiT-type zinc finger domain-containing protein
MEANPMKCHVCGNPMTRVVADLPFRIDLSVMIILRDLPLLECGECSAYALEETVMERVHEIVWGLASPAHLDVIRYVARVSYSTVKDRAGGSVE